MKDLIITKSANSDSGKIEIYQKSEVKNVFDPDKGFHELPIVQISFGLVFLVCFILITIICMTDLRKFNFSAEGLTSMAQMYRVPAAFFTLSLPFFALMAASHRSEQTKNQMMLTRKQIEKTEHQISIASSQNIFSNHFKHVEEFEKYLLGRHTRNEARYNAKLAKYQKENPMLADILTKATEVDPQFYRSIYRGIFKKSKLGDFTISSTYIQEMDKFVTKTMSIFREFSLPSPSGWSKATIALYDFVHAYANANSIAVDADPNIKFTFEGQTRPIYCGYANILIMQAMDLVEAQVQILQFDVSYCPTVVVRDFVSMDRRSVPDINIETFEQCPIDLNVIKRDPEYIYETETN